MARSTFKVLFYVNGSKEKNGIVPIMGRVTINGTVAQFSCKQSVPKTLWDIKGNRAKGKSKEARDINLALDNIKAQIIKHYQRISDREAFVTAEMVRNAYQGIGSEYETEQLRTDIGQLRDCKETAQEELRRAKKEVQTEKLKGAATTAATNIAESVGSLFGSNKVKTLERENAALQNRISELENEAQEREERQAKQMQEVKSAYEQQNRKLSEFADFVKRYFPYVEKLMPTIKFLRDTLHFGDAVIRKLCTFKDVSIRGELYSREFNQHFKVDKMVCSLKEDEEGKFELNIDGVSHISWFRRKKDEFMEALGMPTKRQNRGIKL
ncbi:MAG: hypothetical protein PARBB_03121 [Parabacteroides distasonis]